MSVKSSALPGVWVHVDVCPKTGLPNRPMIAVERVSKYYGAHAAVRDLDFKIEEGECVGFLGLNGAGKSTTLKLLSCLLLPTSGRVVVRGMDVEEQPHVIRRLIGFLPESPPVYPEMTVHEFLLFAGQLRRMSSAELRVRLPEVLETTNLTSVSEQVIGTLSHGYRQRVGIAQAIIHSPALLILDEPIQGLDPVQIVEMRELIRGLRGRHTILLSSHNLSEIEQTCDRILMLHQGRVAAHGTEAEIARRFGDQMVVLVRVDGDAERARAVITKIAGVARADLATDEAATQAGDKATALQVYCSTDRRAAIAKAVVDAGIGLLGLERASGLESIFVELSHGDGSGNGVTAQARPAETSKEAGT